MSIIKSEIILWLMMITDCGNRISPLAISGGWKIEILGSNCHFADDLCERFEVFFFLSEEKTATANYISNFEQRTRVRSYIYNHVMMM